MEEIDEEPTPIGMNVPIRTASPPPYSPGRESAFRRDLAALLNRYSRESASNTPDFILSRYMFDCLAAFDRALQHRTEWYSPEGVTTPAFLNDSRVLENER
jgi:hypothetical protein